jgi:hypothetical protein
MFVRRTGKTKQGKGDKALIIIHGTTYGAREVTVYRNFFPAGGGTP